MSINAAIKEQGLSDLSARLREIVPSLRDQFTGVLDETEYVRYWETKMRGMHAWQMKCVQDALGNIGGKDLVIADIGDSSGNHAAYLKGLDTGGKVDRVISVNLDPVAVEKIRAKGGEAILCRAEELDFDQIRPDLFLSFEMIEHLTDPVRFLHGLAKDGAAEYLFMSVPYRRHSRFGGAHLRMDSKTMPDSMNPEEVHVYEFSPEDWTLLARFAGYRPVFTRIYYQYPRKSLLRLLGPFWRKYDFEGFLGIFLKRDPDLSDRYTGW